MFPSHAIGGLQFYCLWAVVLVGGIALVRTFIGSHGSEGRATKSPLSRLGIAVQAVAFALVGFGPLALTLKSSSPTSIIGAAIVLIFGAAAVALFVASARALGANWSVVARTRQGHKLVRSGPFSIVRHPIYLALFLYMLSFATAFGHLYHLLVAAPIYWAGAAVRVREEERLLSASFGSEHADYVREVPAFIPFTK